VASRGRGANRTAGRSGPRPPGRYVWRGKPLRLRCPTAGDESVGPGRKPPRWSAERGPGRPGTGWSRVAGATEVKECACRRSIHPSSGGRNCCCRDGRWRQSLVGSPADAKAKAHAKRRRNPGAATRRGNEEHCAVSHREYDDGQRFAVRAPRCRTRRARSTPVARRMQTARRSGSVVFRTAQR
jgi:hypothetical protein